MKKFYAVFILLIILISCAEAKNLDAYYVNPDIIYLDGGLSDIENKKPPKTVNERVRKVLHLPPPKKIYYHNIDKSKTPVTMEDYYALSNEKRRVDFDIPEPDFKQKESEFIIPEPMFKAVNYNKPAGKRNIDLSMLIKNRTASSPAVLSPDKTKIVYTKSFFYPESYQTSSAAYFIPVNGKFRDIYDILYNVHEVQGSPEPIFTDGEDFLIQNQFIVLSPLDFSRDSSKIAFKEKIGSNTKGVWASNIVVYDFKTEEVKRLSALREAAADYCRRNKNIELSDYMWDIYPLGWDSRNPERLIAYAYAYTSGNPLFLGVWSIDAEGRYPKLESMKPQDASIDLNGFGLAEIKMKH